MKFPFIPHEELLFWILKLQKEFVGLCCLHVAVSDHSCAFEFGQLVNEHSSPQEVVNDLLYHCCVAREFEGVNLYGLWVGDGWDTEIQVFARSNGNGTYDIVGYNIGPDNENGLPICGVTE